mmetsp:Transcript_17321/g.60910  ORF Transcript_17321/g.60910 Transcript_17321/m.60910 type:complete len:445 (-) Transcript_17321:1868-3202(-)
MRHRTRGETAVADGERATDGIAAEAAIAVVDDVHGRVRARERVSVVRGSRQHGPVVRRVVEGDGVRPAEDVAAGAALADRRALDVDDDVADVREGQDGRLDALTRVRARAGVAADLLRDRADRVGQDRVAGGRITTPRLQVERHPERAADADVRILHGQHLHGVDDGRRRPDALHLERPGVRGRNRRLHHAAWRVVGVDVDQADDVADADGGVLLQLKRRVAGGRHEELRRGVDCANVEVDDDRRPPRATAVVAAAALVLHMHRQLVRAGEILVGRVRHDPQRAVHVGREAAEGDDAVVVAAADARQVASSGLERERQAVAARERQAPVRDGEADGEDADRADVDVVDADAIHHHLDGDVLALRVCRRQQRARDHRRVVDRRNLNGHAPRGGGGSVRQPELAEVVDGYRDRCGARPITRRHVHEPRERRIDHTDGASSHHDAAL